MRSLLFIPLSLIILSFSYCKKNTPSTVQIVIGQQYQGGLVAYVDASGQHGLIASNADLTPMSVWGCQGTLIGTSTIYGQGKINTDKIVSGCPDVNAAAKKCFDLIQDGYNDWFLPSLDELQLLYNNLHLKGKGNFVSSVYASSTESNDITWGPAINIMRLDFGPGYTSGTPKQGTYYVRAVRYF